MIAFLAVLGVTGAGVGLLWYALSVRDFNYPLTDALFIIGIFMFFFSLMSITKAARVFRGVGFTLRNLLFIRQTKERSFYEYSRRKDKEAADRDSDIGVKVLFVSLIYLGVAALLANL